MRNFLKHNFLILSVMLCAIYTYAAMGSTYVRPYGSSDYAGGQKAVGSKVNTEFDDIAAFLNGGNIGFENLAPLAVALSNIKTTANLLITSSSSNYQFTGSLTPATVTNLSTTITTTGHVVTVSLEPTPATYVSGGSNFFGSFVRQLANPAGTSSALFFVRDSSTTGYFFLSNINGASTITDMRNQCSDFRYTEQLAAGTYTYSVKIGLSAATDTVFVTNCRLVVREW